MNAPVARVMVLVAALSLSVTLVGCGGGAVEEAASQASGAKAKPTLEEFLDADSKTGKFTVVRINGDDGEKTEMTGELWVDGRKFKMSLYENGKLIRDITSPDGKIAYFVEHDGKYCKPSVASVDRYLLEFSEPGSKAVEDGTDEQTGATRVVYTIKKLDNMKGSANPWYTEDVTYLVKGDEVIGVITRGDTPNKDGSDYDLDESRRMFEDLKVGAPIPAETFELPYPIKEAE